MAAQRRTLVAAMAVTKLKCYFYDAHGTSLASPVTVENPDSLLAYQTAWSFRDAVAQRRGVTVYLHCEEEPQ